MAAGRPPPRHRPGRQPRPRPQQPRQPLRLQVLARAQGGDGAGRRRDPGGGRGGGARGRWRGVLLVGRACAGLRAVLGVPGAHGAAVRAGAGHAVREPGGVAAAAPRRGGARPHPARGRRGGVQSRARQQQCEGEQEKESESFSNKRKNIQQKYI